MKYNAIGIDPGFKGMIAVLEYNSESNDDERSSESDDISLVDKYPIPIKKAAGKGNELDLDALRDVLIAVKSKYKPKVLILEKLNVLGSGFSKGSSGKLMQSYGQLHAYIDCQGFDYELIPPSRWQKEVHEDIDREYEKVWVPTKKKKNRKTGGTFKVPGYYKYKLLTKVSTINAVERLMPRTDWTRTKRSTSICEDLCDAAAMGIYGIRLINKTLKT